MASSSLTLQPVRSSTARNPLRAAAAASAAAPAAAPRRTSSATDPLRASVADKFLSHDVHLRSHSQSSDAPAVARFPSAVSAPAAGEHRVSDFPRYAHTRYDSKALPRAASDPALSAFYARAPAEAVNPHADSPAVEASYALSEPLWEWEEATPSGDAAGNDEESHGDDDDDGDDDLPGISGRVYCDVLAGGGASPSGERRETADDVSEWQQLTQAVLLCLSGATAAESRLEESVNDVLRAIALAQPGSDAHAQSQTQSQKLGRTEEGARGGEEDGESSGTAACPGCAKSAERVALAAFLAAMGHDVTLCKSMWTANQDMPPGHHHFLEVSLESFGASTASSGSPAAVSPAPPNFKSSNDSSSTSSRSNGATASAVPSPCARAAAVVDVSFQQQFHVARPSRRYQQLLALLPRVFVGSSARLRALVRLMAAAAQQSLLAVALPVAPWRKARYMAKLWFPHGVAAAAATAAAAAAPARIVIGGSAANGAAAGGGGVEGSVRNGVVRRRVVWGAVASGAAGASEVGVASLLRQLPLCCKHAERSNSAAPASSASAAPSAASLSLVDPRVQLIASRLLAADAAAVGGAAITTALHRIRLMMDQLSRTASATVTPTTSTSRSVLVPSASAAAASATTAPPSPFAPSAPGAWSPPAVSPKQRPAMREGSLTLLLRSQERQRREQKEAPMAFHMAAAV
ncbi:hypothetical protein CLOM_g21588 [Closterium sp. NIES-68]|nr:hypothetical protein CLOM_g21588 [Closterium sp. NIES-68]GJP59821.1 hypothetical protein CLOP_g15311 [Closterium sp. NIES-67]